MAAYVAVMVNNGERNAVGSFEYAWIDSKTRTALHNISQSAGNLRRHLKPYHT